MPGIACIAKPKSTVNTHTSTITTRIALREVRSTCGRCAVEPGSSCINPVMFATASTPDNASTTPTNPVHQCNGCGGGLCKFATAAPRCGTQATASNDSTITVANACRMATVPECFGPKKFKHPIPKSVRIAH